MYRLPCSTQAWADRFLSEPACPNWAALIAKGEWDFNNYTPGLRYPTQMVKELFIVAQEVLDETTG